MTNKEFYKEWFDNNGNCCLCGVETFYINKKNKKIDLCRHDCFNCLFGEHGYCHRELKERWLDEEYTEPEVDWTKVAVDTPILVKCFGEWFPRHFAFYREDRVFAYNEGKTSWTTDGKTTDWKRGWVKLANITKED